MSDILNKTNNTMSQPTYYELTKQRLLGRSTYEFKAWPGTVGKRTPARMQDRERGGRNKRT